MKTEFFPQTELVPCYRERKQDRCSECRLDQAVRRMPNDYDANIEALVHEVLDPARCILGLPIRINSGFRCLIHNTAVGGAKNSQHTLGQAADLSVGSPEANLRLARILAAGIYDQMILYVNSVDSLAPRFIHVSYRRDGSNRHQILKQIAGQSGYVAVKNEELKVNI